MDKVEKLQAARHSAEHVLTQAMIRLFGTDKVIMAMGPATDDGFYCDFDHPENFTVSEEDFEKIEAEMKKIIAEDQKFERREISVEEARKLFEGNPYKQEWIDEIEKKGEQATIYANVDKSGKDVFVDLCRGPHVESTGQIKVFKLLSIAGAYWHGDEKNKMLVRIYGTAFDTQVELDEYLQRIEEAKLRDHRRLGKELDLFTFSNLVGSGLPLYTQRGALIRRLLTNYVEELQSNEGYMQVWTPQIAKADLYKKSGHYDKYHADMFRVISNYSDEEMYLKPMNCPQHTQIYASKLRSYRDLPIRMTDFAMLYRDERPGELNGLARVRSFSQDDCHIFCREDQVDVEIDRALDMTKEVMSTFGFKYRYRLSTRDPKNPDKYLGDPKVWDKVENWAIEIMKRNNIEYYDGPGEAAFYAPKMDLMATDALGREWQLSTVQIDYVMPGRFDLVYKDKDGHDKHPIMLHRAIMGSAERFMMILIEHFAGAFPAWMSPDQVALIPIGKDNFGYADKLEAELKAAGVRVVNDKRDEQMQSKIRDAQSMKTPYMLILGGREEEAGNVSIRFRGQKENVVMSFAEFKEKLLNNIKAKKLDLSL